MKTVVSEIETGRSSLGIELGSTRIKAVLIDSNSNIIASGSHDWENRYENGVWTYDLDEVWHGVAECYRDLKRDVLECYGVVLKRLKAIGVSAMMHGYIALDSGKRQLCPFRTWRNNITLEESEELSSMFNYPIAQRWTISHLLKDMKEGKNYLVDLSYVMTLSSYVHMNLTGKFTVGIGDASGMFPMDFETGNYAESAISDFNRKYLEGRYSWTLEKILPTVLKAGEIAGHLSTEGALLLDVEGDLEAGIPFCAPEGDAQTGMIATNSVAPKTGNVSAGTSVFASIVLDRPLSKPYKELDIVMTPDGRMVAMVHSNNCTGSYDAWFNIFSEVLTLMGKEHTKKELYDILLSAALSGSPDCGGILSYGYLSGEHMTGFEEGRLLTIHHPNADFNIANLVRSELFASLCSLRIGLDILYGKENVRIDVLNGHGGFFKTKDVGMMAMSAATKTRICISSGAGEGGAWGIAILASYLDKAMGLPEFLEEEVFKNLECSYYLASKKECDGFDIYLERFKKGLQIEKSAVDFFKYDK